MYETMKLQRVLNLQVLLYQSTGSKAWKVGIEYQDISKHGHLKEGCLQEWTFERSLSFWGWGIFGV